ncbi:putative N-formylglutamate amidohydrolase [Sphingobium sp. SYK-6]|uniref:N-formylglutamate amidohydrolase n=1 Tax=Sphingobium sp. (strain NBRC 103272 / SYK-6) TaxID=627192 RepID=UPI00022771EB|nr:N-formylglutamate amidohydrolase [Sphingobium sp. SYK-6]BAK67575.1 putative N-formylglutamate amidohydrolase [Sphingobium sp. SYK-6]
MTETEALPEMVTGRHDAFLSYGQPGLRGPLIFAVPHAGRVYTHDLLDRARVPQATLARLEDRFADHLAHGLIAEGHHVLVARQPRALIDLNRDEREVDPQGVSGAPWSFRPQTSAKVRGGLGLIPERLAQTGKLWHTPLPFRTLRDRIETVHRPYHAALAGALAVARARHGVALLVDIHSMPPLREAPGTFEPAPRIVIGDRFGRSAKGQLTDLCADFVRRRTLPIAVNTPYSGNHILERHGRPEAGIHAIQIEVDRSLYLDSVLMNPGEGLPAMQRLFTELARALMQDLAGTAFPLAAE